LRGINHDAAYIASVASQIPGPVLLVGHSYGGAVITNAGNRADNVRGLVYVAAFITDEGETGQNLAMQATDSKVGPALRATHYPTNATSAPGTEFTIDPASFHEVFCADLPAEQAAILPVSQRPLAEAAFSEMTQNPAWKTLPSWAIITPSDFVIGSSGERFMAERAKATITEVEGSHAIMISQPQAVADVILTAVAAVSRS
jgi:pimeloyl-ACP methyl ester carboxylesterase